MYKFNSKIDKKKEMSHKSKVRGGDLRNKFKGLDMFGTNPSFDIDGRSTLNSYTGSLLSIFIVLVSLTYLYSRA